MVIHLNHPKYYDSLYSANHEEEIADIKLKRRIAAEAAAAFKLKNSSHGQICDDFNYEEQLLIEEQDLLSRLGFVLERKCEYEA